MPNAEPVTLTVERVGARGDGIASWQGNDIYLPFTAPGDVVRARIEGKRGIVVEVVTPGRRAVPVCQHFGTCGGCALQHLDEDAYAETKESWLAAALAQHGLSPERIVPLQRLGAHTRRRARFQIERGRVGFHGRGSHRIIDLAECAVLAPPLFALLAPLRALTPTATAAVTLTETGIDLILDLPAVPDLAMLEKLGAFAQAHDLARLVWRCGKETAPVALARKPRITVADVTIDLPDDYFLQASREAEAALTDAVLDLIGDARQVADLHAGIGTFTFALARRARVHAVEGAAASVLALTQAATRAGLQGRVTVERRDLAGLPLEPAETARFDALVFDPPYAGAKEQAGALAHSAVRSIVAVSCNPATFARDARLLVDGGYRLCEVRPIDAFIWSANLELVASFKRD